MKNKRSRRNHVFSVVADSVEWKEGSKSVAQKLQGSLDVQLKINQSDAALTRDASALLSAL